MLKVTAHVSLDDDSASDNPDYVAHGLALRNETRTRDVVRQGGVPGTGIIGTWEWPHNVAAVVLPHLDKKIPHNVIARLLNVH
jgi:hypothetical protein